MLPVGRYRTKKGSTMIVSESYAGKRQVSFDWFEEGACYDCEPEPCDDEGYLVWHCAECGGGQTKLFIDI